MFSLDHNSQPHYIFSGKEKHPPFPIVPHPQTLPFRELLIPLEKFDIGNLYKFNLLFTITLKRGGIMVMLR